MAKKEVQTVVAPPAPHFVGDGFRVHNFIPSTYPLDMRRMDPFIMLDYNSKYTFSPSEIPRGVGVHPHKGFETVTIAYKGKVEHHDSSGGGGIIAEGDVQWMTAASGVLHKEFHEKEWSRKGGEFQMVQLWVNLPAKDKKSHPKYQALENAKMARYFLEKNQGELEIIAGEYEGIKGNANTFTPIHMYNAKLREGAELDFHFPENYNTLVLVIEGEIKINQDEKVPADHLALMANKGEDFNVKALSASVVLILSGEPIRETIAAHGPFVMNTREELVEAFNEFNEGKFGHLA
jgi:redox-sensitive bicupin YhaK (pirin superfamily)